MNFYIFITLGWFPKWGEFDSLLCWNIQMYGACKTDGWQTHERHAPVIHSFAYLILFSAAAIFLSRTKKVELVTFQNNFIIQSIFIGLIEFSYVIIFSAINVIEKHIL